MSLENLFNPKSIAIVGASEEEGKVGNVIAKNILNLGYQGEVYLVNPKHELLFGRKCYKSLSEIESPVDLAIISIPAKFVADEIQKNADKVKNYTIISAGFSEIGSEGKKREEMVRKIAEEKELNILGPNCLGFIIPSLKLNASFAGGMPEAGNIAFITQSGALAVGMMDKASVENIKFSHVISIGNKMSLDEADILEYLGESREVKVIGMYLEGIKDGQKFIKTAQKISQDKPIVVIKSGKTERAQKAISSHTGALAGSDEIMDAVFSKTGVIRAENLEEFFNLVDLISVTSKPIGNKAVVITNAGGPGVLATDAFRGKEIALADINDKIKAKLREFLPEESSLENPIDLLGDAKEDRYDKTLKIIGKDESVGSIICVLTPQDQTPVDKIAKKIIAFRKKTKKNITAIFIGGDRIKKAVKRLKDSEVPVFGYPEEAVSTLNDYYAWGENMAVQGWQSDGVVSMATDTKRKQRVLEIIKKAKEEGRKALYFSEAKGIMEIYGIKCVKSVEITPGSKNPSQSPEIINGLLEPESFPVVLKVDSDQVLHKTDKKALILGIKSQEELEKAVSEIRVNFPNEKLIIQPMMELKTELILGIKKDDVFGPILVYGLGGIYTEVLKMVNFLVPPLSLREIRNSLISSKINFLFKETRGQNPYSIEELANILLGLSAFAQEIAHEISEFDINPLLIYNNGKEAMAVDIKIII